MEENISRALARIPALQDLDPTGIEYERLGGLTNLVYKLGTSAGDFCLRIPGEGTGAYIDRRVEGHNTRVAAAAGVSPEVVFFDEAEGLMLTRFLHGCDTMTPASLRSTPGAPARAAAVLRRMHTCGQAFEFRFELFSMIDDYLGVLDKLGATLPEGYHDVVGEAEEVRRTLERRPTQLAPCHCDPLCENFLDDGERMWLVDWEYSGMNDPIWDLGDVSVEAEFGPSEDLEMMRAYCGSEPPPATYGRMVVYKAMCDLLWTLWGLIQHAHQNPADDFWAYSTNRFERCKTLMGGSEFQRHLRAVRDGA